VVLTIVAATKILVCVGVLVFFLLIFLLHSFLVLLVLLVACSLYFNTRNNNISILWHGMSWHNYVEHVKRHSNLSEKLNS
jgi:hypothetical protein